LWLSDVLRGSNGSNYFKLGKCCIDRAGGTGPRILRLEALFSSRDIMTIVGGRKCFERVVELFGIMQEGTGRSGVKGRVVSLDVFCDFLSSLGKSLVFCASVLEPNLDIAGGNILL
jgi:hypothetical protein